MIKVTTEIKQEDIDRIKKYINKFVAKTMEKVALWTYNSIVHNSEPYWSGAYLSSWNISIGSPDKSYNTPPEYKKGKPPEFTYPHPSEIYYFTVKEEDIKKSIYITNAIPYASMIEYEGTPKHESPWMIATHARNNVVGSFKFF